MHCIGHSLADPSFRALCENAGDREFPFGAARFMHT
jgi:hypothetical protein